MSRALHTGPFSHILCWVDGSAEACRAAEYAAQLARRLGAELSFLAIGQETGPGAGFEDYARIEHVSEPMTPLVETDTRACLSQAVTLAAEAGVEHAAQIVQTGSVTTAICAAARAQAADLVVVRNREAGFVARLLTASVSETLTKNCDFAVLSVR